MAFNAEVDVNQLSLHFQRRIIDGCPIANLLKGFYSAR